MKVVDIANIPQQSVRLAVVPETAINIITALAKEGIEVVTVRALRELPVPVASHSDLQLLHLGGNKILTIYESEYTQKQLTKFGFVVDNTVTKLGTQYPQDVSLNFLILDKFCFGLSNIMPVQLINYCKDNGLQVVHSQQGYARCSVAVVSSNAAITSDHTLYRLLVAAGIDTLQVGSGDIMLPGYNTGFIGGCCGLIASNRLAFTGNLNNYTYGTQVMAFLDRHSVAPVYLTNDKLLDIGGILPLMEDD